MKGLRPLLRLDDKVAAEGRRLKNLGAGPSRWGGLTLLVVAAILHGAMLMLPAVHVNATLPAPSPAPDFPRVWRFEPPSPPAARPQPAARRPRPAAGAARDVVAPPDPATSTASSRPLARPLSTEPVPEPAPDVTMRMITSEVEENIPYPDAPPPPTEPEPPFGAAAQPQDDAGPRLIARARAVYPVAARSVGAEGDVGLRLYILPDGRVDRATVIRCTRPGVGFEAAAIDAVKRWHYEPAPQSQAARSVTVTIQFKKQDGRP